MRQPIYVAFLIAAMSPAQATVVETAIETLRTTADPGRRAIATSTLEANASAATPLLLDAIGTDENTRQTLCRTLVRLGEAALPSWSKALRTGPARRRYHAIRAIEYLPRDDDRQQRMLRTLIPLLGDPDDAISYIASYTLSSRGGSDDLVPLLEAQLAASDRTTCIRTALTIGKMRNRPRMPWAAIHGGLQDSNSGFRYWAFQLALDGSFDLAMWRRALGDPHRWLRDAAVRTAGQLESTDREIARDDLIAMLQTAPPSEWSVDTEEEWRLHTVVPDTAADLGAIGVPILRVALARRPPTSEQAQAACASFHIATLEAVAELGEVAAPLQALVLRHVEADETRPAVLRAALRALVAIDDASHFENLHEALRKAAKIEDPQLRAAVAGAACAGLARLHERARLALEDLRSLSEDAACAAHAVAAQIAIAGPDRPLMARARQVLGLPVRETSGHDALCAQLGKAGLTAGECADGLAALITDVTAAAPARQAATAALGHIAGALRATDPERADAWASLLRSLLEDRWLHAAACDAIVSAAPDAGVEMLRAPTDTRRDRLLLQAYARAQPARFVPFLDHADEDVRGRVARALRGIGAAALPALLELIGRGELRDPSTVIGCLMETDGGARLVPVLMQFAVEPRLRSRVIAGLGRIGEPALPTLRELLTLDTISQMRSVFSSIGRAAAAAIPDLETLAMTTEDPDQLGHIAECMLATGEPGVAAARRLPLAEGEFTALLRRLLEHGSNPTSLAAATALASERVTVPGASKRLRRDYDKMEHLQRWLVPMAVIDPESPATADLLIESLAQPSPRLRRDAIRLLAASAPTELRARIDGYLQVAEFDSDEAVREAATAARAAMRSK